MGSNSDGTDSYSLREHGVLSRHSRRRLLSALPGTATPRGREAPRFNVSVGGDFSYSAIFAEAATRRLVLASLLNVEAFFGEAVAPRQRLLAVLVVGQFRTRPPPPGVHAVRRGGGRVVSYWSGSTP